MLVQVNHLVSYNYYCASYVCMVDFTDSVTIKDDRLLGALMTRAK